MVRTRLFCVILLLATDAMAQYTSGIEGTVVLKTVVTATGSVEGVRVVEGNPVLAAAAVNSVKQWRYRPFLRDGKAQAFQTIVLVEFQRP